MKHFPLWFDRWEKFDDEATGKLPSSLFLCYGCLLIGQKKSIVRELYCAECGNSKMGEMEMEQEGHKNKNLNSQWMNFSQRVEASNEPNGTSFHIKLYDDITHQTCIN